MATSLQAMHELIDASEFAVVARNVSGAEFIDGFDGRSYRIPAGKQAAVPVAAAKLWCGDWTRRNIDAIHRDRDLEVGRLKIRLGVYEDGWCPEHGRRSGLRPDQMCHCPTIRDVPDARVEIYSLDGERIWTVLDDPSGARLEPVASGDEEKMQIMDLIRRQETQLRALQAQLAGEAGLALEDVPEDEGDGGMAAQGSRGRPRKNRNSEPDVKQPVGG